MDTNAKNLLIKDLCTRLPYGVICQIYDPQQDYAKDIFDTRLIHIDAWTSHCYFLGCSETYPLEQVKPYLRQMSDMTDEEMKELTVAYDIDYIDAKYVDFGEFLCEGSPVNIKNINGLLDWLNAHYFDYRGLIEKGLALIAPDGMYK